MASLRILGVWLAVCGVVLAQTGDSLFEPAAFDPKEALEEHGVEVSKIDALKGFQERSPERACRAAVRCYTTIRMHDLI